MEACTVETSGSADQTADVEVYQTCTEEGFLCHRKMSFEFEPAGTTQQKKAKEELVNDRGGS